MILFLIGFFAGGMIGVALMACIAASRDTMEKREEEERWTRESSQYSRTP